MPSQALTPQWGNAARTVSNARSASGATCTSVATARAPPAIAGRCNAAATAPSIRIASCSNKRPARRTWMTSRSDAVVHRLAHRGAAEHQTLHTEKPGIRCKVDVQAPVERTAVEQDGLLRQPFHSGTVATTICVRTCDGALAGQRAIEPLRRLRRDRRPCAGSAPKTRLSSRSPPAIPPEVFSVTTFDQSACSGRGNRAFRQPAWRSPSSTVRPSRARRSHAQLSHRALQGRAVRQRGGVVHPPRQAPPAAPTARCRRDPSPRSSAPVPGRNRNTARPAGWPCRPATATARSPGRYP